MQTDKSYFYDFSCISLAKLRYNYKESIKRNNEISNILISSISAHLDLMIHFDLHAISSQIRFMRVRFSISAISTLTLNSTRNSSSKALTIVFPTRWFLTGAFPPRNISWNSRKVTGISIVCNFFCMINSCLIAMMIATTNTNTLFPTFFALCKTLTVKFQTVDLATFTTWSFLLLHIHISAFGLRGFCSHGRSFSS